MKDHEQRGKQLGCAGGMELQGWVWKGSCGVLAPETWALHLSSDPGAFICGGQPATEIPSLPTHAGSL